MTSLGWFLIGCLVTGVLATLVWFFAFYKQNSSQVNRSLLVDSERTRLREEVEAEKVAHKRTKEAKERLEASLCELSERRKKVLEELDEKTTDKIRTYVDDPDLLLGEIDRILAGSSSDEFGANAGDEGGEGTVRGDPPDARGDGHDPGGTGGAS